MIRARLERPGDERGPVFFLGLEAGNVERLKDGRPVLVDLRELGGEGEVCIAYGETLRDIADEMESHGVKIPEDVKARL